MRPHKQKPPKFYVSVAMKEMKELNEFMEDELLYKIVLKAIKSLSERVSDNQLAPLPKELEGSLYDPKMLELRSDEEFMDIYDGDLAGTAEECVTIAMHSILLYDIINHRSCHSQNIYTTMLFDYSSGSVRDNVVRYAKQLYEDYSTEECASNIFSTFYSIYPYLIQFAEVLHFDLNAFIKWDNRYRRLVW